MQRVAYPYTMLMIMKESHLLRSSDLILVCVYLDSCLSETIEYGVPCSCGEGTRANNVSDKKEIFTWYSRMYHYFFFVKRWKELTASSSSLD